jgi:beta-phosphoglucomutase
LLFKALWIKLFINSKRFGFGVHIKLNDANKTKLKFYKWVILIMKKACIFDLDGVIVDTAKYHYLAWKRLADSLKIHFNEHDNEQLKGVSRKESLKLILTLGGKKLNQEEFDTALAVKNEWYLEYIQKIGPEEILPGVEKFINSVQQKNMRVALGSASKNALLILERIQLLDCFESIIDGNKVSKAKPDPEVFLNASKDIDVEPINCIVFEDALAGIHAARRANMKVVGIGDLKILHEANLVIPNFIGKDIDEIIKELN